MADKVYKATTANMETWCGTRWTRGEWRGIDSPMLGLDTKAELCTGAWLHCYYDRYVAAMMLPFHSTAWNGLPKSNLKVRLFTAEGAGDSRGDGLKRGYKRLRILREVKIPKVTRKQRTKFLCLLKVLARIGNCERVYNNVSDQLLGEYIQTAVESILSQHRFSAMHYDTPEADLVAALEWDVKRAAYAACGKKRCPGKRLK